MKSRDETDFLRLLHQCQKITDTKSWRLEKYVDALSEILDKLRNQIKRELLEDYGRKVLFLKGLIETEKLPSAEKRLLAAELLAPDKETKSTHLRTTNKFHDQMRQELLLSNRSRFGSSQTEKRRNQQQEGDIATEITKNLLELTSNIKENMRAAHVIIQKDNETLTRMAPSADAVGMKMQKNTDKLGDFVRKGWCGFQGLAIIVVTITFLMMVVFIRLFPKPQPILPRE